MKKIASCLSVLILLVLGACQLPMPVGEVPTPLAPITDTPSAAVPVPGDTEAPGMPVVITDTAPPPTAPAATELQPTEFQPAEAQPTVAPESAATSAPQEVASEPTATQPPPAATSTPLTTFDPYATYGDPKYENRMEVANPGEWAQPETERLPDNRNITLQFSGGELEVTGWRPGFSTWWFSYHTISDAYIEMRFNSEDCSGEDAYGVIFRGPPHRAGESYGYIVGFTCEGRVWVYRLDGVDPWDAEVLFDEDRSSAINTGPDERNVMGVRADGDQITVFANDVQIAQVEDDQFEEGRIGVYVRAAGFDGYTYRVTRFAYWTLGGE